jgi:hypothetical protein
MLYAYAAADVAVTMLTPELPGNMTAMKRLGRMRGWQNIRLRHDVCILQHLASHVSEDYALQNNEKLEATIQCIPSSPAMTAAKLGFEFRHFFVHGTISHPGPVSNDAAWEEGAKVERCMIEHATACLLMTIQRVMVKATSTGQLASSEDSIQIHDGVWIGGTDPARRWQWEVDPSKYLKLLHLEHGVGPNSVEPPWVT